jgi:DNA-binding NarL/FixJ family response regulator
MEGARRITVTVRVLLVDDNALFRDGIAQILRVDGRFEVVGNASDGAQAVAAAARLHPDLILMDLKMPGMGGIEAIRAIRADDPQVPIGVLTMFETRDHVETAMQAGASGYVAKDSTPAEFCEAASLLAQGQREVLAIPKAPPSGTQGTGSTGVLSRLTERELEVLRMLSTGANTAEIARNLGITTKTLRNHISNTYHKLGIYDRAQAVILAVREGLVDVQLS